MSTEPEESGKTTDRWPFDPLRPGDHERADLPGGTATDEKKKDKLKPQPPAKPVNPPPQAA